MFVPGHSLAQFRASFGFLLGLVFAYAPAPRAVAATITVTSTADTIAPSRGDPLCTPGAVDPCTLRAAILRANALAGPDTIVLQANATYLLTRVGVDDTGQNGDLDILDSVSIFGAGAASTFIDGNGLVTGDRVMHIFHCIGSTAILVGACPGGTDIVVTISGARLRFGRSTGNGGGILSRGILTLLDCAVTGSSGVLGGALGTFAGSTTINRCTFSGSRSEISGGGIFTEGSTLSLTNSTISGNASDHIGGGLAVFSGTASLHNVTIARNLANFDAVGTADGGGIYSSGTTPLLRNSIVTENGYVNQGGPDTPDDCTGTFASSGNNIVTTVDATDCTITNPYSSAGASLGPLQNNGGPTLTHALLSGSAGIDAGAAEGCLDHQNGPLTIDQRGEPRPLGTACDLGAVEQADALFNDGFES